MGTINSKGGAEVHSYRNCGQTRRSPVWRREKLTRGKQTPSKKGIVWPNPSATRLHGSVNRGAEVIGVFKEIERGAERDRCPGKHSDNSANYQYGILEEGGTTGGRRVRQSGRAVRNLDIAPLLGQAGKGGGKIIRQKCGKAHRETRGTSSKTKGCPVA